MGTFEIGLKVFCLILKQQVNGNMGVECGAWNDNDPHGVIYLHAQSAVGECFGND